MLLTAFVVWTIPMLGAEDMIRPASEITAVLHYTNPCHEMLAHEQPPAYGMFGIQLQCSGACMYKDVVIARCHEHYTAAWVNTANELMTCKPKNQE